jgi:hypothetical protein
MNKDDLIYYFNNLSTNHDPEIRVKENKQLKNSLLFGSYYEYPIHEIEQKIGKAKRISKTDK